MTNPLISHTASLPAPMQLATAIRSAVYTASYMILLPLVKEYLEQTAWAAHVAGGPLLVAGVTAGVVGSVLTHPMDTVKTRMQVGDVGGMCGLGDVHAGSERWAAGGIW